MSRQRINDVEMDQVCEVLRAHEVRCEWRSNFMAEGSDRECVGIVVHVDQVRTVSEAMLEGLEESKATEILESTEVESMADGKVIVYWPELEYFDDDFMVVEDDDEDALV